MVIFAFLIFLSSGVLAEPLCIDSDASSEFKDGRNFFVRGNVTLIEMDKRFFDSCLDEKRVNEFLCENETMTFVFEDCKHGCRNGRCLSVQGVKDGLKGFYDAFGDEFHFLGSDKSGNGNNAFSNQGVSIVSDNGNAAIFFDGISGLSIIPESAFSYEKRSFSAWFKTSGNGAILGKVSKGKLPPEIPEWAKGIYISADGKIKAGLMGNESMQINAKANDKLWHLFTITFNGSRESFYLDGEIKGSGEVIPINGSFSYYFGAGYLGDGNWSYYEGMIDNVMIYNRALEDEEVQNLYFLGRDVNLSEEQSENPPMNNSNLSGADLSSAGSQNLGNSGFEGSSGGGGGGGRGGRGDRSLQTIGGRVFITGYTIKEDELARGYNKILNKGERFYFNISNEKHHLELLNISNASILIEIASEIQRAELKENETKSFELTNDSYYDLNVTLNEASNRANITIKGVNESVIKEEKAAEEEVVEQKKPNKIRLIILAVVFILALIYFVRKFSFKEKEDIYSTGHK